MGVEHGDVATLMLQVHVFLELLQGLVRAHVGVGELWKQRNNSIASRKMHLPLYIEYMVCRTKPTGTSQRQENVNDIKMNHLILDLPHQRGKQCAPFLHDHAHHDPGH